MAKDKRVSLADKRQTGQGAGVFDIPVAPATQEATSEVEESSTPDPLPELEVEDDDRFKMTVYVSRELMDDFDESWARVKRGAGRFVSRTSTFEAALKVAMSHEDQVRDILGIRPRQEKAS